MELDQFYTKDDVAEKFYKLLLTKINCEKVDLFLEPSAGKGAFFKLLPLDKRKGIDLDPKYPGVEKMDLFNYIHPDNTNICTIGNPPFGKGCSLAVKFFNYTSRFSSIIAFIIPRTFSRVSVQNKLNLDFHLIYSEDIPLTPCAFTPKMSAKCCFQIWEKRNIPRSKVILQKSHSNFSFIKPSKKDSLNQPIPPTVDLFDFVMKAYGGNCGKIFTKQQIDIEKIRPKSWHFIKSHIKVEDLIKNFNKLDYSISKKSTRQDSLGQQDLIKLYCDSTY